MLNLPHKSADAPRNGSWLQLPEALQWGAATIFAGALTLCLLNWSLPTAGILLTIGLLLLLLWKPAIILVLYPILLLVFPPFLREADFVSTGVRADQLLLLIALFVAMSMLVLLRLPVPVNHITMLYAVYICVFVVATCYSKFALGYPPSMVDAIQIFGLARPLAILLVGMVLVNSVPRAYLVVRTILFTSIAVIAFGFGQLGGVKWVQLATLAVYNRKNDLDAWKLFNRITATFDGQSNLAGMFAYIVAGLVAGLLLTLPLAERRRWALPLTALLVADLIFLLGTASRGALAGVLLGAAVLILLLGRRSVLVTASSALAVALAGGVAFSPLLLERLYEVLEVLSGGRIEIVIGYRLDTWREALDRFFWPSPLIGSGAQTFLADSSYIAELAQRGVIGLVLYCSMLFLVARAGYVTWRFAEHPLGRALGMAVLTSTLAIIVQGVSITVLSGSRTAELWWFIVACMLFFYPAQRRIRLTPEQGEELSGGDAPQRAGFAAG